MYDEMFDGQTCSSKQFTHGPSTARTLPMHHHARTRGGGLLAQGSICAEQARVLALFPA